MPTVEVIINACSGAAAKEDTRSLLSDLFGARGIETHISLANTGAEVVDLAQRAVSGNAEIIVAGGGDGTINAVASEVVSVNKTLGILPLGTLNHFAKDLHIPLDVEAAVRTIIAGYAVQVDVGEVNDRIFLNNSSLGLYPRIVRHRERQQRLGVGKWPAYLWAGLAVLRRYPFVDVRLIVDGEDFFTRTPFVFIGNNVYEMEGFNVGTRARVDAGVLSLYVTNSIGRFGLLRLALRVLLGRLRDAGDLETMTTNETRVETRRRLVRVATDGEVALMPSPLHYRIRPGALRVLVPKTPNRPSEEGISDAKACASL